MRGAFGYDVDAASDEAGLRCEDETLALHSMAEECDINTIVRRFGLTGELPQGLRMPEYGDFTAVVDYHTAMNAIREAEAVFNQMPAEVRLRFDNNPGHFVDFCADDENYDEAVKLGLVSKDRAEQRAAEKAAAQAAAAEAAKKAEPKAASAAGAP